MEEHPKVLNRCENESTTYRIKTYTHKRHVAPSPIEAAPSIEINSGRRFFSLRMEVYDSCVTLSKALAGKNQYLYVSFVYKAIRKGEKGR